MEPQDLLRWVEARRAADERERLERRERGVDRERSVRAALSLIAFAGRLHGWPLPENEVRRREDALVQESWMRLRSHYGGR
ncbi:MAG TPA: hypothetical protein VNJ70_01560 [Thermoanaerobaculia bacterium]|nr:hypothetical protein [Thermoanaerobaculia bacterium]